MTEKTGKVSAFPVFFVLSCIFGSDVSDRMRPALSGYSPGQCFPGFCFS